MCVTPTVMHSTDTWTLKEETLKRMRGAAKNGGEAYVKNYEER